MKKPGLKPVCFLLSFLVACLGLSAGIAREAAFGAYRSVLLDGQPYTPSDGALSGVTVTDDVSRWYGFIFDPPLRYTAFAITDLDLDGSPEVLLKLSGEFGFELLRYESGAVYGFPFVARAMEAVKKDGVIHGSSGAGNFGWYQVKFRADTMETVIVCWQYDDLGPAMQYFIGGVPISQGLFTALNDELWQKEDLTWTPYTPDNLDAALSME